ncbi:MAG: HAMP domain-containing histidine kinase [Rhizobiales bacterium]|nr:HAMP domain-containing histidine kinase [Hyphomicrobiales bacterium]
MRVRLYSISVVLIFLALFVVSQILIWLFEQHVHKRVENELSNHINQIASQIEPENLTSELRTALSDPLFELPGSGLYWQLKVDQEKPRRSRSLWDHELDLSKLPQKLEKRLLTELPGPDGTVLTAVVQDIELLSSQQLHKLRIVVGQDGKVLAEAVASFSSSLGYSLFALFVGLSLAVWLQISAGLRPMKLLERQIAAVRRGEASNIAAREPTELLPVIHELNGLLDQQLTAIEKSQLRAGRLAHGLKTPMAILMALTRQLKQKGSHEFAGQFEEQIEALNQNVERELARARTVGGLLGIRHKTHIKPLLTRLVTLLQRLPRGEEITWSLYMDDDLVVPIATDDLAEILGNILDNSRKWAKSKVAVDAEVTDQGTKLTIEDDGAQLPADKIAGLSNPGERLDDGIAGSGLGLSIVKDVLDEYGGELVIKNGEHGGLSVVVNVPHHQNFPNAG